MSGSVSLGSLNNKKSPAEASDVKSLKL